MELFEAGKLAESAGAFEPYCASSPLANAYCAHLGDARVDAITTGAVRDSVARSFDASLLYQKIISGGTKSQITKQLNSLTSLATNGSGTAYLMLAKLLSDSATKKWVKDFIRSVMGRGLDDTSFNLRALELGELRALSALVAKKPNYLYKGKTIVEYHALFKDPSISEGDVFYALTKSIEAQTSTRQVLNERGHDVFVERAALLGNLDAQLRRATELHDNTDAEKAICYLSWAAEQGHSLACGDIGHFYNIGLRVPKDPVLAEKYTRRAAESGNPVAINNLGIYYQEGTGVDRDFNLARELFTRARALGVKNAANLGMIAYLLNEFDAALDWLTVAINDEKSTDVFIVTALILLERENVDDKMQGLRYLKQAAENNDSTAADLLFKNLYANRSEPAVMQMAVDAFPVLQKYAFLDGEHRNLHLLNFGFARLTGLGCSVDQKAGLFLLEQAARRGAEGAYLLLAEAYEFGFFDVEQSFEKAVIHYEHAYDERHDVSTAIRLGVALHSRANDGDDRRAAQLFSEALTYEPENPLAAFNLAILNSIPSSELPCDFAEAKRLFEIALLGGDPDAAFNLGWMCVNDKHHKNLAMAYNYFAQAEAIGHRLGGMAKNMVQFLESGRIDAVALGEHQAEIVAKMNSDEKPNDILNFVIYLQRNLIVTAEQSATPIDAKLVRLRAKLDQVNAMSEVDETKFHNLAHKVLRYVEESSSVTARATKSGAILTANDEKFGHHHAHKNKSKKLRGKALEKGKEFIDRVLPGTP